MVDRIREILSRYQLTPTQFADAIGTARPIVSHILSGRNKPSLEVVQKIVAAFPDLSLPWLLTGTGPIEAGAATVIPPQIAVEQPATQPKAPERLSSPRISTKRVSTAPQVSQVITEAPTPTKSASIIVEGERKGQEEHNETSAITPSLTDGPIQEPTTAAVPVPPAAELPTPSVAAPTATATSLQAIAEPGKVIRRIVIFYSDGTFSDYQPEIS